MSLPQIAAILCPVLFTIIAYFLNRLIVKQDEDSEKITNIMIAIGRFDVRQDSLEERIKALEEWKAFIDQELTKLKFNQH